jgi:hypothetical protein
MLYLIVGKTEIRVVEEIEELDTDLQSGFLPSRYPRVLGYRKVGVKEAWPSKSIPPLGKMNRGSAAGP